MPALRTNDSLSDDFLCFDANYKLLSIITAESHTHLNQLFKMMSNEMAIMTKRAHIVALTRNMEAEKHWEIFNGFSWFLFISEKHTYILGDIGPIAAYKPNLVFKPFLFAKGYLAQIFLPISDRQIIVGKCNAEFVLPKQDEINAASASLSQNYFISSDSSRDKRILASSISSNSSNISMEDIVYAEKVIKKEWLGEDD